MSRAFGQESLFGASATHLANADVECEASLAVAVTKPLVGRLFRSIANWAAPLASRFTWAVLIRLPGVTLTGLHELTA